MNWNQILQCYSNSNMNLKNWIYDAKSRIMGLIVLVNENLIGIIGALWVFKILYLENSSSIIDVYFLYRSVMDLDAIQQAVLYMLKIRRFH